MQILGGRKGEGGMCISISISNLPVEALPVYRIKTHWYNQKLYKNKSQISTIFQAIQK